MIKLLALSKDFILMLGNEQNKQAHQHYAMQLCIPVDNIEINGLSTQSALFIDSDVRHFVSSNAEILSFWFHPESMIGREIKQEYFKHEKIVTLHHLNLQRYVKTVSDKLDRKAALEQITQYILEKLLMEDTQISPLDSRIKKIIHYMDQTDVSHLHYDAIVSQVFLSKSRLTHLFKKEIGTSITKYLLWKRLLYTSMQLLKSDMTFTEAAHQSGFADAAHFSRTFKANFGIDPRTIFHKSLKNSCPIHVFTSSINLR